MNETTKYGLAFLGGVLVGALGAVAITRGKLDVKPLAADLLAGGMNLRDKAMNCVESVKEDLADVVAEAQVKAQERAQASGTDNGTAPAEAPVAVRNDTTAPSPAA